MADDTIRTNILSYGSATDIVCSQHDVLRHLALYLGRIAHLPDSGSIELNHNDLPPYRRKWLLMPQKSQIPEDWKISGTDYWNAEIISINTEALTKEHWSTGMSFPTTKALLLYLDGESSDLPRFRESVPELKVLVIQSSTNCNVMNLEVLDGMAHLQILYLQGFNNDDFHCFRGFQGLQKLYLTDLGQFYTLEGILSGPSCTLTDLILRLCNGLETMMINKTYLIPSLRRLFLENCSTLPNLPGNIGSSLANLEVLSLKSCEHLETLPDSLCNLAKLQHLDLSHCNGIRALPEDFGQLSNLRDLKLAFCDKLRALPSSITQLHSLHLLLMVECNELESLPEDFGKLSKLYNLELHSNRKLQRLPSSIWELRALRKVTCDDKFLGQWESFKESHISGLQVHRFVSQS